MPSWRCVYAYGVSKFFVVDAKFILALFPLAYTTHLYTHTLVDMADSKDQLQANTYIWSQSDDQVTISFLVPETCKTKDLEVRFEHQHVCAGLKGQEPVLKVSCLIVSSMESNGTLYDCIGQVVFAYQSFRVVVAT